jgi:DNA-binding transcriptional MerR regulator
MTELLAIEAAEAFRATLPRQTSARRGTIWTADTFGTYVNLRYPLISFVAGQEWEGAQAKYDFYCAQHGEYEAWAHHLLKSAKGCGCSGCKSQKVRSGAGRRNNATTDKQKQMMQDLRNEGYSYSNIAKQIGVSEATVMYWLNPLFAERSKANRQRWYNANADVAKFTRQNYLKTEHGSAMSKVKEFLRRMRKGNVPDSVFLDGQFHDVARDLVYRGFSEILLPFDERARIGRLYAEADRLTEETGIEHHVDHIQPLSKGGEHLLYNLQILTAQENLSKNDKFSVEDQALVCRRLFS